MTVILSAKAVRLLLLRLINSVGTLPEQQLVRTLIDDYGVQPGRALDAVAAEIDAGSIVRTCAEGGAPIITIDRDVAVANSQHRASRIRAQLDELVTEYPGLKAI